MSRSEFSSLLSSSLASVATLHPGECYAGQDQELADMERCNSISEGFRVEVKHLIIQV